MSAHHYGRPLTVEVKNGQLSITIGVQTLARAARYTEREDRATVLGVQHVSEMPRDPEHGRGGATTTRTAGIPRQARGHGGGTGAAAE